jgi:hypothetical protein
VKEDQDRQMLEVSESLKNRGKNILNLSQQELNRELRLWRINEKEKKKRSLMTQEEQLIDLFFD